MRTARRVNYWEVFAGSLGAVVLFLAVSNGEPIGICIGIALICWAFMD